ncbi:MAG: IS66 family transposase, partial [Calditrichaeota bacterium]|nr:IS66 family transposase [Calditrichota bacterium]
YGCMAHARRKFTEALNNDRERAEYVLAEIQRLYTVERQARNAGLSHQERQKLRQTEARPVLEPLKAWLNDHYLKVLPKSAIGQAIAYALARWSKLCRYVEDGRIEIDNNLVENAIRPVALGRKNYLFAGSHAGAERAAMIYSLVTTAKVNGVEPFVWLQDVLTRIADHPHKKLAELLPGSQLSKTAEE